MNVVRTEINFFTMFFGSDMKIIVFIVFFADGAESMLGVGAGEDLNEGEYTS